MNVPIIRLEVEGVKHSMQIALSQYSAQMDSNIQAAVENYCQEGKLAAVINDAVKTELDAAVRAEVRDFFGYGKAGRKAVKEAIVAYLARTYPEEWYEGEVDK